MDPALISVPADGDACAVLTNPTGCSVMLEEGNSIGEAVPATLVCPPESTDDQPGAAQTQPALQQVQSKSMTWRRNKLAESIKGLGTLTSHQRQQLLNFLQDHHATFALEEHERGETDLMEMNIDTGDAEPRRCAPRRMPFAVRAEVARQLDHMQAAGAISQSLVQSSCHGAEKGWHP